jgi:hypothetical protein
MAVIVWKLDLQLPMQLMPITTDVVSSNLDQVELYYIMWSSLSVTCERSVVYSTNKTGRHDITEILLKVTLNTIKATNQSMQE